MNSYQTSLDFLYSFVDYSLTRHLRYSPEKFNLDRMHNFMRMLGNPHLKYPTIHVAGTKGKGSICAMISSIMVASGLKVGLYTSPHLQEYTERIKINGKDISKRNFISLVESLKPHIIRIKNLSTFEITTAMAFQYFLDESVDLAVIEVGLGGRLDATNVVNPILAVISSISKDHIKILGNSLSKIAFEKAGIIKENVAVVVSKQKPHVKTFLGKVAIQRNSPFIYCNDLISSNLIKQNARGQDFLIQEKNGHSLKIHLPLIGDHQIQNAMTAFSAIRRISRQGFQITDQDIQKGFSNVKWPGRCEILATKPLLMVDCAHNTDSMQKLIHTIKTTFPGKKIIALFGASEDKDIIGMLRSLLPAVNVVIAAQSIHPRAMDAEKIKNLIEKLGYKGFCYHSLNESLAKAVQMWDDSSIIIVTGSIFIAAAVRDIWKKLKTSQVLKDALPNDKLGNRQVII